MDAARGPSASTMNRDDDAGDAFDKLRSVVRKCEKGAAGFDHDLLQIRIAWLRYDIDANSLLLAKWPGPGLRKSTAARHGLLVLEPPAEQCIEFDVGEVAALPRTPSLEFASGFGGKAEIEGSVDLTDYDAFDPNRT